MNKSVKLAAKLIIAASAVLFWVVALINLINIQKLVNYGSFQIEGQILNIVSSKINVVVDILWVVLIFTIIAILTITITSFFEEETAVNVGKVCLVIVCVLVLLLTILLIVTNAVNYSSGDFTEILFEVGITKPMVDAIVMQLLASNVLIILSTMLFGKLNNYEDDEFSNVVANNYVGQYTNSNTQQYYNSNANANVNTQQYANANTQQYAGVNTQQVTNPNSENDKLSQLEKDLTAEIEQLEQKLRLKKLVKKYDDIKAELDGENEE